MNSISADGTKTYLFGSLIGLPGQDLAVSCVSNEERERAF